MRSAAARQQVVAHRRPGKPSADGRSYTRRVTLPALEVRDLVKRYAGHTAVDGVSLRVERGQLLALLGPNGAGKTSIIEICEGYRSADGGSVRVLDHSPTDPAVRPRIGVMLQQGVGGYTGARALEMVELFASYAAHPHRPAELLDLVGLSDAARTPVKRLSGGQQQRLSLALALVGRPELVFLDEPTAGMDPQGRHATWDIVSELTRDGVAVVLTTHYLEEAERLADQVVVLDAGVVVAEGAPAELMANAGTGLRFSAPTGLDVTSMSADLRLGATVIEVRAGHYAVSGVPDPSLVAAVTGWCARAGVLVTELSTGSASLEDAFLELTGHQVPR